MRCLRGSRVVFLLHLVFLLAASHAVFPRPGALLADPDLFSQRRSDVVVVHPVRVDVDGRFVSHWLSHHFERAGRHKRDLRPSEAHVYYKVNLKGRSLFLNLTVNSRLVSSDYVLERRNGSLNRTEHRSAAGINSCHLVGTVTDTVARGIAAISTCEGLRGLFTLSEGTYFIEPAQVGSSEGGASAGGGARGEPHVVYPRVTTTTHRHRRSSPTNQNATSPCGVKDAPGDRLQVEREREEWEREQQEGEEERGPEPRGRTGRSVSRERWVETMVVADSKLIHYHGSDNVESYIFTIMNMVAGIFHDASIGNAIHIILVRLILLQGEESGLKIVHHADTTLGSFCSWQKNLNPQSDTHPAHHDVAVLVTRKDICASSNHPCETLGLSHLSGMCQPHRSCNINEDSGLPVAFTIAHEMGHSFGIHHDGQGNDCELEGRHPFIMSRQLMYDTSPLTWSPCSKDYITRFLDRGWGFCLDDRPSKKDLTTPLARLGVRYTTHYQCQLQYGPNATFCPEIDNVCQILWCSINGTCRSKLDSPIDGTRCGPEKWCISGECVMVGKLPETVNGGWGQWSGWSHCSRTCGAGVQSSDRQCNSPKPEFGGKYCTGERRRYRVCNTRPCQKATPTFREMLCSEFDTVPYQNQLYHWIPVASASNPCELHCRPVDENFSEKMLDAVTDGTPCFMNNNSRNICVNGVCKEVGCDFGIDSNAVEDRCGVCLGDDSSCETIQNTFDGGEDFGYVDVGMIPMGARDIMIQEVEEAGNFLALRGQEPEDYYLNGHYIIQWNGQYEAAGTTFYYERSGNLENLTSAGPTRQPLMIQLLYQERNPGIKYEYTIKKNRQTGNEVIEPEYRWKYGAWTDCSTTCGTGDQQQPVRCFEVEVGVVDEFLCDPESRPDNKHRKCKNMDCPARWWVGGWQPCSSSCGSEGVRKRTVLCVRTVLGEERVLHPLDCKHLIKPKPLVPCNRDQPCGNDWAVGNWSRCPVTCGGGVRSRLTTCVTAPRKPCDLATKPRSKSLCALQPCPNASLRRRPGPPPKHRRPPTPSSPSPGHPFTHTTSATAAPGTTTPTLRTTTTPLRTTTTTKRTTTTAKRTKTPTLRTTTTPLRTTTTPLRTTTTTKRTTTTTKRTTTTTKRTTTTTTSTTKPVIITTTPDIIDADDYAFSLKVGRNGGEMEDEEEWKRGEEEGEEEGEGQENGVKEEEGSTPDLTGYTPAGYNYVVEDATTDGQPIRVMDIVTTATTLRTTSRLPRPATTRPPELRHTTPRHAHTTTALRSAPHASLHYPLSSRRPRLPLATTETPHPTAPLLTPPPPHPTLRIVKPPRVGGPAPRPRKFSPPPHSKSPAPSPDGQEQRPGSPVMTFAGDHGNQSVKEPVSADVAWVAGNWSECSVSCGVGAVWRMVECSSGREEDCSSLKKPEPARTCHPQPCSVWLSSNWTRCPVGCGVVGRRQRDVQCVDSHSRRPLRPFHCQALTSRPPSALACPSHSCLPWKTSPWGPCSSSCGEGVRERLVFCPESRRCSATLRPGGSEPCSLPPCPRWDPQDWEECSVSCGEGVQRREVRCVSGSQVVMDSLCETTPRLDTHRACNTQECKNNTGAECKKNSMSSRFCDKLKLLGRCSLRSIQRQCCVTCRT